MSIIFCGRCFSHFQLFVFIVFTDLLSFSSQNRLFEDGTHQPSKNTQAEREKHETKEKAVGKIKKINKLKMTPPHQWQWGAVLLLMGTCVIGISAQGTTIFFSLSLPLFSHSKWLIK